ncbi:MAG TPA: holo-ACP synthase [Burkholderiaceae bacterium]|nr:holo-ACP synthase [Burkholderiaceae bacterium]HYA76142.1 holo-ACP synthase [Burkholderiaceae bacterium]
MILGIGTDAVEVARIEAAVARHGARFAQRILGPRELVVHAARAARSPQRGTLYLATRFAAKEAISKALGLGMREPMYWRAAQIVNAPSGRPQVVASGALAEYLQQRRIRLHVSVSDLDDLALAYAIAETDEQESP